MVNDYVKDDLYNSNNHHGGYNSDDDMYRGDDLMSCEEWQSYHSDDLYNIWSRIRDYIEENGVHYIMQGADYTNFAEHCYEVNVDFHSTQEWQEYYANDLYNMWSLIRGYKEFVDKDNFIEYCYNMSYGQPYEGCVGN